jgi:hypothetical protein
VPSAGVFSISRVESQSPSESAQKRLNNGLTTTHGRFYNRAITSSEVTELYNEPALYDDANTPVVPPAPIIPNGGEDNDTNTITLTPSTGLEVRRKGGDWSDTTSPYTVTYELESRYEIGEIEFRVKAEGINPESDITANTIAFTEADQIEKCTVTLFAQDLLGVNTDVVKVRLFTNTAKYKSNIIEIAEVKELTPDTITGKIEVSLTETDNMEDGAKYIWDFGCQSYITNVPNVGTISFWNTDYQKTATKINQLCNL